MRAAQRRLVPPTLEPGPLPLVGEVWSDEDGDVWWAQGHLEAHRMVLASALEQAECCGPDEVLGLLFGREVSAWHPSHHADLRAHLDRLIDSVGHLWCYPDPADEERFHLCTASHDEARPITRLSLVVLPSGGASR